MLVSGSGTKQNVSPALSDQSHHIETMVIKLLTMATYPLRVQLRTYVW